MRTLIREAMGCKLPLELNMLGLYTQRNYPNRLFWELVAEEGAPAIVGVDAHVPDFLKDPAVEAKIAPFLEGLDIAFMEKLPISY